MPDRTVLTVLGPIPAAALGTTLAHEHLFVDLTAWFVHEQEATRGRDVDRPVDMSMLSDLRRRPMSTTRDNILLNDEELTIEELERFRRAGGNSVVDVTVWGMGRDPLALQRVSRALGINIVMGTGFYVENAHPDWVRGMSSDELADLMVREITVGVGDTGVRCGVIGEIGLTGIPRGGGNDKVGPMTPEEEKVLRGAARASLRTGLAVTVHTDRVPPLSGLEAIDVLEEEGVAPSRIVIGHLDQVEHVDYHLAIAARGVFVEYDSLGRDHYWQERGLDYYFGHDSWRVRFAKRLIDEGHGGQLLFSQDVCMKTDLHKFGGPGYSHVLDNIVPTLRALGVTDAAIQKIQVENPARAFSHVPAG